MPIGVGDTWASGGRKGVGAFPLGVWVGFTVLVGLGVRVGFGVFVGFGVALICTLGILPFG